MIQEAQDLLKTTLASCAAFQTFTGTANSTNAALRIHHDYLPDPDDDTYTEAELAGIRPCALIYTEPNNGWTYRRDAAGTNNWGASGRLIIVLMRDFPANTEASAADVAMRGLAGDIIEDLRDKSETGGLAATGFSASGPFRTPQEDLAELGDRQAFEITVDWGNRI